MREVQEAVLLAGGQIMNDDKFENRILCAIFGILLIWVGFLVWAGITIVNSLVTK